MHGRKTAIAIFICMAGASFSAQAAFSVATPTASAVLVNGSYQVTATTQTTAGAVLISGGLNLLRVDGAVPVVLGPMHDDGLNGDAVAHDGIYTFLFSATSVAPIQLQASAALSGTLRRLKSGSATVPVVTPGLTLVAPNSATQGTQGLAVTVTGQNTHFSQGTTTANFGTGVTVTALTVTSATSVTITLNVTAASALGAGNVTLTSGLEVATLTGGFMVNTANLTGDVFTWHYDNARSGLNPNETTLTTANVKSTTFGKLGEFPVDGQIDGQVLYLHQVNIPGVGLKNVVYFATENDSVYALDASTITGSTATVLWKSTLLPSGERAATSLPCGNIVPNGITATPVIDRARNAIYVVAKTQNNSTNAVIQRIYALDLTTGSPLFGGPTVIAASYPGSGGNVQNGMVVFDPKYQNDRAALLESGNTIFTAWSGMDGDCGPYSPWVISYSADTLAQTAALDLAPSNYGGGMWMGGAGPAADSSGNVYVITGNGFGGATPVEGGTPPASYNNSMVKLSPSGGLIVADYFTPDNTIAENNADLDFGSVGPMLVDLVDNASTTHHLAMAGGKDGKFYVVDRQSMMGEFSTSANNVYQTFTLSGGQNRSTAVYYNGTVFLCPNGSPLKAFSISNAKLATSPTQSSDAFGGDSVISASSNGNTNGIVWAIDHSGTALFAYNATNVTTNIYNSNQATGSRDHFSAIHTNFNTPTVVDGKVYFGTSTTLVVFGLLP